MTTPRDPDRLLSAYLADGIDVLPDRVVDAVLDEAHRTRQRVVFGPRRTPVMNSTFKVILAAAAVIAVVVAVMRVARHPAMRIEPRTIRRLQAGAEVEALASLAQQRVLRRFAGVEMLVRLGGEIGAMVVRVAAPAKQLSRDQPQPEQRDEPIRGLLDPADGVVHGNAR